MIQLCRPVCSNILIIQFYIRGDVHFHFATLIGICPIRQIKNDRSFVCVNIERKQMFVYLRCNKKKNKILQMESFLLFPAFFLFPWFFLLPCVFSSSKIRFLKDICRGDNEHNIGSEIKSEASIIKQWV